MKNQIQKNIQDFGGMEFATFKLKDGVTETSLFEAIDEMVNGLYKDEACFLGHCLLKGKDNTYVEVVFATSQEDAAYLCGKWGQGPFAEACISYMDKIDPETANIAFYQRIK